MPDDYGVYGVEKTFDADLRGRAGIRTWLQNEKGKLVRELTNDDPMTDDRPNYQEPRKGYDVYLTLDARIQYIAEKALRESTPAIGRGSVVVLAAGHRRGAGDGLRAFVQSEQVHPLDQPRRTSTTTTRTSATRCSIAPCAASCPAPPTRS